MAHHVARALFLSALLPLVQDQPDYALEPIPREETGTVAPPAEIAGEVPAAVPRLPEAIPPAFARLLQPQGYRLKAKKGNALIYDLWLVKEVPLRDQPTPELGVAFGGIPHGTVLGVLRSYGKEVDYRDDPIDEGWYSLRFSLQPSDGNHLGTTPTRDYLMLTSLAEDKDPAPIAAMEKLFELAAKTSLSGHAPILLLIRPDSAKAPEKPALYSRNDGYEWVADLVLPARAAGAEKPASLRMGLILIGYLEDY